MRGEEFSHQVGEGAQGLYPVGANGGSQAIIDARVLARELASRPTPAAGLASYEGVRLDATSSVILANREMDRAEWAAVQAGRANEVAAIASTYQRAMAAGVDRNQSR